MMFIVTALVLLGLLAGIPVWTDAGADLTPFVAVALLAVGVVVSAILGRSPKD
jgi:hypothetical protein